MKSLILFKFGGLAILLVLSGCALPLVDHQDNPTAKDSTVSSFSLTGVDDTLTYHRMRELRAKMYTRIGGLFGEDAKEFFIRYENGYMVDAATNQILGTVDPVTKVGQMTLCTGKVHVFCKVLRGVGVDEQNFGAWEITHYILDGISTPAEQVPIWSDR